MQKIGVVGPLFSLKKIRDVTNEFEHEIEFIDFPYNDAREVKDIITTHRTEVNGWFLSGPIPYHMAKKLLNDNDNFIYCAPVGPSLYRCLIQMFQQNQTLNNKFSIDMIESEDFYLNESLEEIGFSLDNVFVYKFKAEFDLDEIVSHHYNLWKNGEIGGALTVLNAVYEKLKELNVPVYKINMTKMEIRQAVQILIETARGNFFKDSQIGVEIIEINQLDTSPDESFARYKLQYIELGVKKILLELCEKLDGSLIENGNGRYQIFSARKAIERELNSLKNTVDQIQLELDTKIWVGIGFGRTAVTAENNATKALMASKNKPYTELMIMQEDGTIIESTNTLDIVYPSRTNDLELVTRLKESNINIKTYKKIEALTQRLDLHDFTANDIAHHLSMTLRNAQRILSNLSDANIITTVGEEINTTRGRPRKIYKFE